MKKCQLTSCTAQCTSIMSNMLNSAVTMEPSPMDITRSLQKQCDLLYEFRTSYS